MKTIHWGIIGAGNISSQFATALTQMKDTKLVAVASRDLGRAKDFAGKFQIEKAYGSYEDIVGDPDIDVIYIGTPHSEHKDNAALCIKNGKAVLCEKAFTINESEANYLIDLAKEHNVFLMEAMWTKFLPTTIKVKEWVKEGRIGKIKNLQMNFGFHKDVSDSNRLVNKNLAGGALLDVGIYPITYTTHLLERLPDQVVSTAVFGKTGVDEKNGMIFTYNDGTMAMLGSSITTEMGKDANIVGEKGRIFVPHFWSATEAFCYDANGEEVDSFTEEGRINGYEYEAYEVNQCLREGKLESNVVPLQDTKNIIKLMESMRKEWGLIYPGDE